MAKSKRSKVIAITGGCGFIGTNIALKCIERGYEPYVIDNLVRSGSEFNNMLLRTMGVKVVRADVRSIGDMVWDTEASAIIHLAGNVGIGMSISAPYFDFTQNVVSTVNMLEIARAKDIPMVFASTNKVYSDEVNKLEVVEESTRYSFKDVAGVTESFRTDGAHHTPYGVSKLTGDLYCQEYFQTYGVKTVVNRMSCIYGLYQNGAQDQGWVDHFVRANMFNSGKLNIFGDGKQVRDVLWGGDVADLYLDELENIDKCAGEVFNVGGGPSNTLSLLECIREIEKQTEEHFDIMYNDWRPADQKVYVSDITKVTSLLGWKPTVSPHKGIARMIKAYKNGAN